MPSRARGCSDGLTFRLRREHVRERHVGIELEVNQRFVERGGPLGPGIRKSLVASLRRALECAPGSVGASEGPAARTQQRPADLEGPGAESPRAGS